MKMNTVPNVDRSDVKQMASKRQRIRKLKKAQAHRQVSVLGYHDSNEEWKVTHTSPKRTIERLFTHEKS